MADRVDEKPIDMENKDERDIVLSARDVTVGFGSKVVLDNLNLNIYRGEILGFVGASGTGKSVLMRTVLRLLPRRSGTIKILGQDFDELDEPQRNALDMRLGVLFQQGALFSSLTVKETSRCRCANISTCRPR